MGNVTATEFDANRFGDLGRAGQSGAWKDDRKFLAAKPGDGIARPICRAACDRGDLAQCVVARHVAVRVVVALEIVDVEHQQRELGAVTYAGALRFIETIVGRPDDFRVR